MTYRKQRLGVVLFVGLCAFVSKAPQARADTYSITVIANDDIGQFIAGDDFGDYVADSSGAANSPCGVNAQHCYLVNLPGAPKYETSIPTLRSDPAPVAGAGCVATPSNFSGSVFCNNGHQIFAGEFVNYNGRDYIGTFQGINPLTDLIGSLSGTGNFPIFAGRNTILTANGDIYLDDQENDYLEVAIDTTTTTPEPSTWLLLGTGLLAMLGLLRQRDSKRILHRQGARDWL